MRTPIAGILNIEADTSEREFAVTRDVRKFGISDKRGRSTTSSDPYLSEAGRA